MNKDGDTEPELVSLAEVKNMLQKAQRDREELTYEQKIALEHAQKFARLPANRTEDLIKDLLKIERLEKRHAYKIADLMPMHEDDVKTIFAKERFSLSDKDIKKIVDTVNKHHTE